MKFSVHTFSYCTHCKRNKRGCLRLEPISSFSSSFWKWMRRELVAICAFACMYLVISRWWVVSICWCAIEYNSTPVWVSASFCPYCKGTGSVGVCSVFKFSNCLWCSSNIDNMEIRLLKDVTFQCIYSHKDIRELLNESSLLFSRPQRMAANTHSYKHLRDSKCKIYLGLWL